MYSCSQKTLMGFILFFNFVLSQTGNISGTELKKVQVDPYQELMSL